MKTFRVVGISFDPSGLALKGGRGTISSCDHESTIRLQDPQHPEGVDL